VRKRHSIERLCITLLQPHAQARTANNPSTRHGARSVNATRLISRNRRAQSSAKTPKLERRLRCHARPATVLHGATRRLAVHVRKHVIIRMAAPSRSLARWMAFQTVAIKGDVKRKHFSRCWRNGWFSDIQPLWSSLLAGRLVPAFSWLEPA